MAHGAVSITWRWIVSIRFGDDELKHSTQTQDSIRCFCTGRMPPFDRVEEHHKYDGQLSIL